ncbi:hypothetical protein C3497_12910 [Zoogloeaceae bacteirum Par-f-2]|jgi:glycosyltransferase involved in cell wall biosynthesis|uniref:glycosyltransferase n=1 Tax=Pseudothauera hydrothermalis TaxID=2184083 RepID=UPI000D2596CC|nr:glycosyltransferase [Pseudothauera hydrothermalis]AVZ80221.1 hypothetical protein C3497_12910 [Zoogloeaceae bacteirum Par-f-2]
MKSLLLVTTSYPVRGEGEAAAGTFVRDFAHALRREGLAVSLAAPAERPSEGEEQGLWVKRFKVPRLPLSLLKPLRPTDWAAIYQTLSAGAQAVDRICQQRRPDHILALWALPSGAWARAAAKIYGMGYSTWALGSDIWTLGKIPLLRHYLGSVLQNATHRFADGYQLAADVEALAGKPCAFLPSSRDFGDPLPRRPRETPPYRLAFLGRWHPNKGIDLLIEALKLLDDETWAHIEMVRIHGGGPLEQEVRHGGHALEKAGRPIQIGGYLDLAGARELFNWTDFVLIPSRIESIPVIFSDAMQACRPVIATPVGDLPRLVNSLKCGHLTEAVTAAGIATGISRAVERSAGTSATVLAEAAKGFQVQTAARTLRNTLES